MTTATAAIYCRVSTTEQARADAVSLTDQEARGRAAAEAKGWSVGHVFADPGHSGNSTLAERPGGRALLDAVARGEVSTVIVWDMSRFTRSASKGLSDWDRLTEAEVTVVLVKESIDTSTASGRLFRTMLAAMAEWERETIRERTLGGQLGAAVAGRWPGSRLPFGYMTDDDGRVIEDPERAPVVRRIFEARASGHTLPAIAETLNAEGLTMRPKAVVIEGERFEQSADFSSGSLSAIIRRPSYMGGPEALSTTIDGKTFTFEAPSLVEANVWRAAQHPVRGRKTNRAKAGKRSALYALGEARVQHDHGEGETATMFGQFRTTKGGKLRVYRCMASRAQGTESGVPECPGLGVSWGKTATAVMADLVEARFGLWALDLMSDAEALAAFARDADRALLAEDDGDPDDLDAQRARVETLKSKRARYVDMFAEGIIERTDLDERIARIDAEASALAGAIERAEEVDAQRLALSLSLDALLNGPVIDMGKPFGTYAEARAYADHHGGRVLKGVDGWQAADAEDPLCDEHRVALDLEDFRAACRATLSTRDGGRPTMLPDWAIVEVANLASLLGVRILATEGDDGDPERPSLRFEFAPSVFADQLMQGHPVTERTQP